MIHDLALANIKYRQSNQKCYYIYPNARDQSNWITTFYWSIDELKVTILFGGLKSSLKSSNANNNPVKPPKVNK